MYRIDQRSPVPVYEQLARQVERGIVSGRLRNGEKLPSIRELASTLRINPNTVAKTYRQLEKDGLVTSRKGLGIFVSTEDIDLGSTREILITELMEEYIRKARALGLEDGEIVKGLSKRLMEDD